MGIFLNLEKEVITEKVVYRGNGISISTDSTAGRNGHYFKRYMIMKVFLKLKELLE